MSGQGMYEMIDNTNTPTTTERGDARFKLKSKTFIIGLVTIFVALTVAFALWYQFPTYKMLLKESNVIKLEQVVDELRINNISYRFDADQGYIFVAERNLTQAKKLLSAAGLYTDEVFDAHSSAANPGAETQLDRLKQGLPYYALEKELAKTISTIDHVRFARIHLAISPNRNKNGDTTSRASVVLKIASGHHLAESQILSISQLVSASVPDLPVENITIVNQSGKLLKTAGNYQNQNTFAAQFEIQRRIELSYIEKIENVLSPIIGDDNFRVEVSAALNNINSEIDGNQLQNKMRTPSIRRITVSILVDDKLLSTEEGQLVKIPRNKIDLERIAGIVKKAVDFNAERGDVVTVVNESFGSNTKIVQLDLLPFWRKSWFVDSVKLFVAILASLIFSVYLFRALIGIIRKPKGENNSVSNQEAANTKSLALKVPAKENQLDDIKSDSESIDFIVSYDQLISKVRKVVLEDPVLAANILKTWVRHNAG